MLFSQHMLLKPTLSVVDNAEDPRLPKQLQTMLSWNSQFTVQTTLIIDSDCLEWSGP